MKSLLLTIPLIFTFTLIQLSSIDIPKHSTTTPIQLSEVVVHPCDDIKFEPIIFPEVIIHGNKPELKTIKFYPPELPEVIVIG